MAASRRRAVSSALEPPGCCPNAATADRLLTVDFGGATSPRATGGGRGGSAKVIGSGGRP